MNLGKPIFILLALIAFLSALWRGLPPIGFIEVFLWAGLALLWTKKDWRDVRLNYALLAVAGLILLGEGYQVGVVAGQQQQIAKAMPGSKNSNAVKNQAYTPALAPATVPDTEPGQGVVEQETREEAGQFLNMIGIKPVTLIARCGKPLADKVRKYAHAPDARILSYTDIYDRKIAFVFSGPYDIYVQYGDRQSWSPIVSYQFDPPIYSKEEAVRAAILLPCAAKP
jgi:hypothetical protein